MPQRIATAGFGGFEVAKNCPPRPTTVAVDCVAIGAAALGPLLRANDAAQADTGQRLAPETVQIAFHIKQRESN